MAPPKIVVYTTDYCPYCTAAKNLLASKNVEFEEIDLTDNPEGRAELVKKAQGRRTVPQIFIDGRPYGGFDDLKALDLAGQLDSILHP